MKNLLKTFLLVGLFIASFSSDVYSQTITNTTDCAFRVTVYYDFTSPAPCVDRTVTVAANSVLQLPAQAAGAEGTPLQLTLGPCDPFKIGDGTCPAAGSDLVDIVNCTAPGAICTTYRGTLISATGSILIQ